MPKVSIVVPAYNAATYIAETLDSLLAQDHPDVEIIAVDDGSTDATPQILNRYAKAIRIHRQTNAGQSAALAAGWAMSGGEYIGYLSADDLVRPAAARLCAEALQERADTVLVYPDFDLVDEQSQRITTIHGPDYSRRALYGRLHCLPGPGALFRREAYERAGPWATDLRQIPDLDFFLRMGLLGDFHRVPQVLAAFRQHPQSMTYRTVPFAQGEEPLVLVDRFFSRADLPAEVRSLENSTRAHALLLSAAIHGKSRRRLVATQRLLAALCRSPNAWSRTALNHVLLITRSIWDRRD